MRTLNVCRPVAEWRDPRHRRGLAGEVAAARWLESHGFVIESHRFRLGHHDLDLIARRADLVAFVEVKARTSAVFGPATLGIGWRKRRSMGRVASVWIARFGRPSDRYRFDVVTVVWRGRPGFPDIEHIEGAFFHMEK